MGDVQLHFHVHQTNLSPVLLCALVHCHPDTRHLLQDTMFEPLDARGPPEWFGSPWQVNIFFTFQVQVDKKHRLDMNHYATKKSAAQSMLDVALLMANSSQLKTILYVGPGYRFYIPLIVLLGLSITLQVVVGLLLVFLAIAHYDLNDTRKHAKLERMNNAATVFVFFTVLINIFITALGFQSHSVG
uniref:Ninjurin-1-like n=1 Tax=Fundulus heteroclitus TaxID=8078 RepID=A0A3Q2QL25_FUNHE